MLISEEERRKFQSYIEQKLKDIQWLDELKVKVTEDNIEDLIIDLVCDLKPEFEGSEFFDIEKNREFYDDWYDEVAEEVIEPYLKEKLPTWDHEKRKAQLNVELYKRMCGEFESFREELLTMSPQEILRNACEFVDKEDIIYSLEGNDLEIGEVKALLKREHPLEDVYLEYANSESEHMSEIYNSIKTCAHFFQREDRLKEQKKKDEVR